MIAITLADLPVAAVHCTSRGKVVGATTMATSILDAAPGLIAEIVALVVETGGRGGSAEVRLQRRDLASLRLVAVQERYAAEPGACVVFLLREAELPTPASTQLAGLTPREREVAQHAAGGLRNWEIAERIGCRERTVRAHLQATYLKLGMKTRVELAKFLAQSG